MEGRARGLQDGQLGRGDRVAGPAAGDGTLGGAAAARTVVDVPDQFPAQGRAQDQAAVPGEVGHARTAAGLDDGEGRAGALDLAGGRGEQFARDGGFPAEDGGDLVRGQVVTDGEFEGLALLRGGAGRLRPGQQGQFAAPLFPDLRGDGRLGGRVCGSGSAGRVGGLTFLLGLGQLAQARPAGQGVQPGPAVGGLRGPLAAPLGQGQDVAQGGGGRVVVAQHRQTVGEQSVQVRLVAPRRPLGEGARGGTITRLAVHAVRSGAAGGGLWAAARHPCDRRRPWSARSRTLSSFNPHG